MPAGREATHPAAGASEPRDLSALRVYVASADPVVPYATLRRDLRTGAWKDTLARWWLELVEQRVADYLRAHGYVDGALPERYLDDPPASLDAIRSSLDAVRSALSPASERSLRADVLDPVRRVVYERIAEYEEAVQAFVAYEGSGGSSGGCPGLAGDLEYIREMRRGEAEFAGPPGTRSPQPGQRGPRRVVPVSGLVYDCLLRHENVLSTALSHWSSRLR
eukprot:m51a1_g2672 hypothetical protein (221) ;mRNA; f:718577-719239